MISMLFGQSLTQESSLLFRWQINRQRRALAESSFVSRPSLFGPAHDVRILTFYFRPVRGDIVQYRLQLLIGNTEKLLDQVAAVPALERVHHGEDCDSRSSDRRSASGFNNEWCRNESAHEATSGGDYQDHVAAPTSAFSA